MAQRKQLDAGTTGKELPARAADSPKGFRMSASRTIAVTVDRVYAAWMDGGERAQWLRNDELVVTDATPAISLRGDWGTTRVCVFIMPRGTGRANVTVDQELLPTAKKAAQMKKFWQARLGRLAAALERARG